MFGALRSIVVIAMLTMPISVAQAADKLTLAVHSVTSNLATVYVAKGAKLFEAEGVDVTINDLGGGTNVVASLVGGSADVAAIGMGNFLQARSRGQDLKAFAMTVRGYPNWVVASAKMLEEVKLTSQAPLQDRLQALRGRTIAVNDMGGSAGDFIRGLLARGGLKEGDVTLINMPSGAARLAALKAGRIDAALSYPPEPETATLEGYGKLFISALEDLPETKNVEFIPLVAQKDFLANNRDAVIKLARAIQRAADMLSKEPDRARDIFFTEMELKGKGKGLAKELQQPMWSEMLKYNAQPASVSKTAFANAMTYFKAPAGSTMDALVDATILPEAQ